MLYIFLNAAGTKTISLMCQRSDGVRDKGLTVALALLVGLVLVVGVDVFGLSDPVQVALQILLQLLLFTQLLEVSASLGFFSLLGKLSEFAGANMDTLNA